MAWFKSVLEGWMTGKACVAGPRFQVSTGANFCIQ